MNRETHYTKIFTYTGEDVIYRPDIFYNVIFEKEIGDIVCDKIYPVVEIYSDGTIRAYHDEDCTTYNKGDLAMFFDF